MTDPLTTATDLPAQTAGNDVRAVRKQYQAPRLQRYGKIDQLTQTTSTGTRSDASSRKRTSDLRCKENLVRIGEHPWGFGLYLYTYRPEFRGSGEGIQFGVIAQEVERVVPEAVFIDENGLRSVDYDRLGILH